MLGREVDPYFNRLEIRPELKVIFMSGYSYGSVRAGELLSKNYLCLEKPLTRANLARWVRKTLDH